MNSHDSGPTQGHNDHEDGTERKRAQPNASGSPVPENLGELHDPQSRLTLEGDAYGAFGNDSDHKSASSSSDELTPADNPPGRVEKEDPYGREGQPDRHSLEGDIRPDDDWVRALVLESLSQDPLLDISGVSVEVSDGCVTLTGTIPDHRMKATIEDAVDDCAGVKAVINRIEVVFGGSGASGAGG